MTISNCLKEIKFHFVVLYLITIVIIAFIVIIIGFVTYFQLKTGCASYNHILSHWRQKNGMIKKLINVSSDDNLLNLDQCLYNFHVFIMKGINYAILSLCHIKRLHIYHSFSACINVVILSNVVELLSHSFLASHGNIENLVLDRISNLI